MIIANTNHAISVACDCCGYGIKGAKKFLTSKDTYAILSKLPKTAGVNVNPAEVR